MALAKGYALASGRSYVTPDDIKRLAQHALPHRIIPTATSNEIVSSTEWKRECIRRIVNEVKPGGYS
jgi:MoxR-like ATPase